MTYMTTHIALCNHCNFPVDPFTEDNCQNCGLFLDATSPLGLLCFAPRSGVFANDSARRLRYHWRRIPNLLPHRRGLRLWVGECRSVHPFEKENN